MEDTYPRDMGQSVFSIIWYAVFWHMLQFLAIAGLHFIRTKTIDKSLLRKAFFDTILLAIVFMAFQQSQQLLSNGIYRVPYIIFHLFADLVPSIVWLALSELMFLVCLGLVQKLYHHIVYEKININSLKVHFTGGYLATVGKSQHKLLESLHGYIKNVFPQLVQKYEQRTKESTALRAFLSSAFLLLELSTLGLVFVEAVCESATVCYQRMRSKRKQEVKTIVTDLLKLTLVTITASGFLLFDVAQTLVYKGHRLVRNQVDASRKSGKKKSMNENNGASVTQDEDSEMLDDEDVSRNSLGSRSTGSSFRHHED